MIETRPLKSALIFPNNCFSILKIFKRFYSTLQLIDSNSIGLQKLRRCFNGIAIVAISRISFGALISSSTVAFSNIFILHLKYLKASWCVKVE